MIYEWGCLIWRSPELPLRTEVRNFLNHGRKGN